MAKATIKPTRHMSLNDMFGHKAQREKRHVPKQVYAVRQLSGPVKHKDQIISAVDSVEAVRQWFCHYGLAGQTYRYRLKVVEVPADHPLANQAIECMTPRSRDEMTLEAIQKEQFDDVQDMIDSGEAAAH